MNLSQCGDRPFEFENVTKGEKIEKTRESLKGCLHSTKLVQISIQFDEFFDKHKQFQNSNF